MASVERRLATNIGDDFFVDASCIDCNTCRWVAPASFDRADGYSRVYHQPTTEAERLRAAKALIACPVSAIGARDVKAIAASADAFPDPIADEVYHCGYHSRDSFGAASYLIVRPAGNILVDSPRFARLLVKRIEAMGGIRFMFLTHKDDIADHAQFRRHFGCDRIIHEAELGSAIDAVEKPISGTRPVPLDDDVLLIPTPGHSTGSMSLLYRDKFLFSGDHASWEPHEHRIRASRIYSRDWVQQARTMGWLAGYRFEWLLPGHGTPVHLPPERMAEELRGFAERHGAVAAGR